MTDPNAGFPTGNNSYGAPQPAQPASDANAAYQQPQYTAPVPPAQPVPPAGAPYQAPATPDYAANIQNSVAGFAQNLGGKNVTVGGQSFDFISIITYVAGVLAIIACIVPFVSAFGYSASLFQGGERMDCPRCGSCHRGAHVLQEAPPRNDHFRLGAGTQHL